MLTRIVKEKIKIKDLFHNLEIPNVEHASAQPNYEIKVKTPYGFQRIENLFRTEKQESVTLYFGNNKTLKTSYKHRLKCNGEWKYVDEIVDTDVIETETGYTYLKSKTPHSPEILYDISVDSVHCYYSNGILSHNSWALVNIGSAAMRAGKTVFHYTLELYENYTGKRYDSVFSGVAFQNLNYNIDEVKQSISKIPGNLIVEYAPAGSLTVSQIKGHIEKSIINGIKPDLIIVDYADLLRGVGKYTKMEKRHELGNIYVDLRGLAGEFRIPIWSASQGNRCLHIDEIVETSNGKIKIIDLKVNDLIKTHVGYKRVTQIYPVEIQPVYEITLKSGKKIKVSANHEFPTSYGKLKSISNGLNVGDKLFTKKK